MRLWTHVSTNQHRSGDRLRFGPFELRPAERLLHCEGAPAPLGSPQARRQAGESLADTLARLHAVDWHGVGLGDLGRPDGFNRRHLRRISAIVSDPDGGPPPPFAALTAWLAVRGDDSPESREIKARLKKQADRIQSLEVSFRRVATEVIGFAGLGPEMAICQNSHSSTATRARSPAG